VHNFYVYGRGEFPTARKLIVEIKELGFDGRKQSLHRILKKIVSDRRGAMMEGTF
jgi:hypothetical protein